MAIVLVSKDERHHCTVKGVRFTYRRISIPEQRRISATHTKRGQTDHGGVALDMARLCLLDWDASVLDQNGNPAPFSQDLVGALPEDVVLELLDYFQGADPREALLGNSEPGSQARYETTA